MKIKLKRKTKNRIYTGMYYFNKISIVILIVMFFYFALFFFMNGYINAYSIVTPIKGVNYSEFDHCYIESDLYSTSICVNEQMKTFWHYNISNNVPVSIEYNRFKTEGAACKQVSLFYKQLFEHFGYDSKVLTFGGYNQYMNRFSGHAITMVYDEDEYCILDGDVEPDCVGMEVPDLQ